MKYVMNYTFKPHMSKDETASMMETFAVVGEAPGRIQHLVRIDGQGVEGNAAGLQRNNGRATRLQEQVDRDRFAHHQW